MDCPVCSSSNPPGAATCAVCAAALTAPASHELAVVLKSGTKLQSGKYSVEKVLGQGGFGITYRGTDGSLNRAVAIKEYFPNGCVRAGVTVQPGGSITIAQFQQERGRFLDEAKVLAHFRHEAIVQVYASFEENNTAYMVMELVQGSPLIQMIEQRGPIPESEALKYIVQVSHALREVHKAQMLHRDIKPDNIVVTDSGRAVLIDFGTARQFVAGKTKRMTAMLTQGYAPLEQYGQQARFGTYTDIYALCATFYHIITGQIPVQATDRATGVDLTPPHRVNSGVSRRISDAIMWGLEMKATARPQTVDDLLGALDRGRPDSANQGSQGQAGGQSSTGTNQYEARILQLLENLKNPSLTSVPASPRDKEIQAVRSTLAKHERFSVPDSKECPACHADLVKVTGHVTGTCPVCNQSQLKRRKFDPRRCPLCRRDALNETVLEKPIFFCPVCRASPLRQERRKKFGLAIDLWWVCGRCEAEFDVLTGGKVKFVTFKVDPFGFGAKYRDYTFSTDDWREVTPLTQLQVKCNDCRATFYELDDDSLTLVAIGSDPFGVGKTLKGKAYYRSQWLKVAYNLPKRAGNAHCPGCSSEFDFDKAKRTLALRSYDTAAHPWVSTWYDKVIPIDQWYLMRAGKQSLTPGWLCSKCDIEFDDDPPTCKLVRTTEQRLKKQIGRNMLPADWHRYAAGVPTSAEQQELLGQVQTLESLKRDEIELNATENQRRRARIDAELADLYKRSFLSGALPIQPADIRGRIPNGEKLRWESKSFRMKQRTRRGIPYWESDTEGTLIVTDARVLFVDSMKRWERTLDKLVMVETQLVGPHNPELKMIVAWFTGLQRPVGFFVPPNTASCTLGGHTSKFTIGVDDLLELLRQHS